MKTERKKESRTQHAAGLGGKQCPAIHPNLIIIFGNVVMVEFLLNACAPTTTPPMW